MTKMSEGDREDVRKDDARGLCAPIAPQPQAVTPEKESKVLLTMRGEDLVNIVKNWPWENNRKVPDELANAGAPASGKSASEYADDVRLIRASDVPIEAVTWLWNGWLAVGKMHVLGGAPGTGKTTISMGLAATVTTGGRWPDGTRSIAGNVVIWSGEDNPNDTLIPRLAASGADLSRVYFIADVLDGNEPRPFDPARDVEPLRRKLAEIGDVKLLIIDPIVSVIAGDSHKNAEVRRGLQPLVDLAGSMRCAILGITRFSKGTGGRDPVERLARSLAFGALARVVLVAAKYQKEGEDGRAVRLFCRAKSNIGPNGGGFEYELRQVELKTHPGAFASSVLWGRAVEGAARELLAAADATGDDLKGGALANAKRFLSDLLADGPLPAKTIKEEAEGAGYSWATIRRAREALGIVSTKKGGYFGEAQQQWLWRMPDAEDAQQKKVSTFNMNSFIREAQADGVRLTLSPAGTIKVTGDGAAVNRWLSVIREHKAEIIDALKVGAGDTATAGDGLGTLTNVKRFLTDLLADGPMRAGDVFKDADQAGYSKRSIQRAANALKIERRKDGMKGGWIWRLPPGA